MISKRPPARPEHLVGVVSTVLAALLVLAVLRETGALEPLGLTAYDLVASRTGISPNPNGPADAVVIGVTEPDIARFGWPLSDSLLDAAITSLRRANASVVAIDIYRASVCAPSPLARWTADSALPVIFAEKLGLTAVDAVRPPECAPGDRVGFTDVVPDDDQVVRRFLYVSEIRDTSRLSLAYQAVAHRAMIDGVRASASAEGLPTIGRWTLVPFEANDGDYVRHDDRGYQVLVARAPDVSQIRGYSLAELLDARIPAAALTHRVVFVGASAPSLPDVQRLGSTSHVPEAVPGVRVHALAASQALHRLAGDGVTVPIRHLPDWAEWLYVVLAAALAGWSALASSSIRRMIALLGGALLVVIAAGWLAMTRSVWIPVVQPGLTLILAGGGALATLSVLERRDRRSLMDLFSRHVSPEVADEIWRRRAEFTVDGRPTPIRLPVTVLFADIRGYTSIAERADPVALMTWLNTFMGSMADQVIRHGGVVDDYAGDGMKADFGIPFPRDGPAPNAEDAGNAVRCALAMGLTLETLNEQWRRQGLPHVAMRIGIASGTGVAGSVGSQRRMKYTVVGDVVNTAARLESLPVNPGAFDEVPWRILVDRATYEAVADRFRLDHVGPTQVKGKDVAVDVFQVRGVREDIAAVSSA